MSGSKVFLRKLPCGLNLHYRSAAVDGSWRRILANEDHFSMTIGNRVNDEGARHMAQVQAKTGTAPTDAVVEDTFHSSPNDQIQHSGIVYEDEASNHLSKKHVSEKPGEQALSDNRNKK